MAASTRRLGVGAYAALGVDGVAAHQAWSWHAQHDAWRRVPLPDAFRMRETPGIEKAGRHIAILGGARTTAMGIAHGEAPDQPDLGNVYGDGIVVDVVTDRLTHVPIGPL